MTIRKYAASLAIGVLSVPSSSAFSNPPSLAFTTTGPKFSVSDASLLASSLQMQRVDEGSERRMERLSATIVSDDWDQSGDDPSWRSSFPEAILPVLSTSLMITGNTVGAGMLVLPELAAGPGMGISSSIFTGAFLVNLVSGLVIAEIGINQYANSGDDVPSSFKDFAEVNLNSHTAANVISCISMFVNAFVMAFNTVKVGDIGSDIVGGVLPSEAVSVAWVLGCAALVGTQTFTSLSAVASLLVTGLFISFGGLLLPGLAQMTMDPATIMSAPGTSVDVLGSASELAPVVLMSLVYQNIVPTVTKILDYDRTKTAIAVSLGSFIPFLMYMAWTFAVNGGGIQTSVGLDGPLITVFYLTTIAGSSIGCIMSLAEEIESFLKPEVSDSAEATVADKFTLPAVMASVSCSWITAQFFADDLNSALKIAGSFGSPLLYGVLPVVMAFTQRQRNKLPSPQGQMPVATLATLGVASTGFVGNEIIQSAGEALSVQML
eukprot:scaffold24860_cov122-Cylindrotheca_fusiformis.AAC.1